MSQAGLLLIVLDQLVEAEQDTQPTGAVVRLQVVADLVHDGRPLAGVVVLDHVMNARRELYPEQNTVSEESTLGVTKYGGGL